MIIRTPNRDKFTIISNVPLNDERLSWKARGLLAYLLSKPDSWAVVVADLVKRSPDGRASVLTGLVELEKLGYIKRSSKRGDAWRFDGIDAEVFEEPTAVRFSDRGKTDRGKSTTSNYSLVVKTEIPLGRERDPDLIFEALADVCGIDITRLTPTARSVLNRATKELRQTEATPEQIRSAATIYRQRFPDAALTPSALVKHYPSLRRVQSTRGRSSVLSETSCDECHDARWVPTTEDERMVIRCHACSGTDDLDT